MDYRTGRHVVYMLHVHLVFVTKYRRDVLSEPAIRDLQRIFNKVFLDFGAELIECDGEDDHVHFLVHYPPKVALSRLVNSLKGVSSRLLAGNHRALPQGRSLVAVLLRGLLRRRTPFRDRRVCQITAGSGQGPPLSRSSPPLRKGYPAKFPMKMDGIGWINGTEHQQPVAHHDLPP